MNICFKTYSDVRFVYSSERNYFFLKYNNKKAKNFLKVPWNAPWVSESKQLLFYDSFVKKNVKFEFFPPLVAMPRH